MTADDVRLALKDVFDPELGYNIVDIGLIYGVTVDKDKVAVTMTMTTPGCPAASYIEGGVRQRILAMEQVADVDVTVVWTPPWSTDMMSDDAKHYFGWE